jgi:hypothetical protein
MALEYPHLMIFPEKWLWKVICLDMHGVVEERTPHLYHPGLPPSL